MKDIKCLRDLLYTAAEQYNTKTYMRYYMENKIEEKSFIDLKRDSNAIKNYLATNYNEHIHVAVIGRTSYEYVSVYFGTVNSKNVIVPIDAMLSVEDICHTINRADIDVLFYDEEFVNIIPTIIERCKYLSEHINMNSLNYKQILLMNLQDVNKEINIQECCTILYTSGTTGNSKGVMLSNENLIDNTMCMDNESSDEDILLSVLPIHHAYCFTCDILLSLRYGSTVCINDSMMHLAKNIQKFKPSIMLVVPMILESMLNKINDTIKRNKNISKEEVAKKALGGNIKIIYSGGAYLSKEIIYTYEEYGIKVQQGYGMTECSPRIATGFTENKNYSSVGKLVNGCECRIVDGEIQVKSKSVMTGYYMDEKETRKSITKDGWLRTGDLGTVDKEGYVYITGRIKNLIILSNGENVSPEEIENKFSIESLISEIVVYASEGVVTAQIYPNFEYAKDNNIEKINDAIDEIVYKVNCNLSNAKKIKKIIIRNEKFIKTTTNKIIRSQVVA